MPYIKEDRRRAIDMGGSPENAGELNYAITLLLKEYMEEREFNYQVINDINGALTGAQQEFYRRIAAPYEDLKMRLNGDVYT